MNGFENKVYSFIKENGLIEKGSRVCVALSGGADSVALLHILKKCKGALGITLSALHINHMIRGAEADRDEMFCRDLCERLEVDFAAICADVPALAKEWGVSVELAARRARYNAFENADADVIATAHNMSDNAETVLYNLARGTALSGLCGIPLSRAVADKKAVRPLLCVSSDEIRQYLSKMGEQYVLDSTNLSDDYTRNKIRHTVVPAIKEAVNPSFEAAILSMCMALRDDEYTLEALAQGKDLSVKALAEADKAVAVRIVKNALAGIDGIGSAHINAVLALAKGSPSAQVSLPCGYVAARQYDRIVIEEKKGESEPFEIALKQGRNQISDSKAIIVNTSCKEINNSFTKSCVDCDKITGQLKARSRKEGDKIALDGGTRSVKKLMIDLKIPAKERDALPVICDDNGIVAVALCGVSRKYKTDENSKNVLEIEFEGYTI